MWPFDDAVEALNTLYECVIGIPMAIADIFIQIIAVVLYPFVVALYVLQEIFNAIYEPLVVMLNAIIGIPNAVINIVNLVFVGTFPSIWTVLIVGAASMAIGLRIYSFLKDVEIVGCKI